MYFRNFRLIDYNFGDNEAATLFPNISAYVDIIDQVKQEVAFYEKYTILDGDRPDIVSQKLYGTPNYHWTFFAMNDGLRESGWPLPEREVRELMKKRYPHRVVTTQSEIASFFLPGVNVIGKTSGTTGVIVERNLDLGQLVIASNKNAAGLNNNFGTTEQIAAGDTVEEQAANVATAIAEVQQFNAPLYYKNASGTIVDIDPYNQNTAGLTPTTVMEDNIEFNNNLKSIVVIKPSKIATVANEYFKLLRE
ncbi:hypothetical protein N9Z53_03920 [Mariniblastus sp.]|nr:hypothetical protein [Mariniblastus sp.]